MHPLAPRPTLSLLLIQDTTVRAISNFLFITAAKKFYEKFAHSYTLSKNKFFIQQQAKTLPKPVHEFRSLLPPELWQSLIRHRTLPKLAHALRSLRAA